MKTTTDDALYKREDLDNPVSAEDRAQDILERFTQDTMDGVYTSNSHMLKDAIAEAIQVAVEQAFDIYHREVRNATL